MRKDMAMELKSWKEPRGISIYQLVVEPVSVCWKRHKHIESSIKEFDQHHKWKVITWLVGSSLGLSSNFGISKGNLAGIVGQKEECSIGSLVNRDKFGRSRVVRKGNWWLT
jgi:hypothetical protein